MKNDMIDNKGIVLPTKKEIEQALLKYQPPEGLQVAVHPKRKKIKGKPVYEDPLFSQPVVRLPISNIIFESGHWRMLAHEEAIILSDRYGSKVCLVFPSIIDRIKATSIIELHE
jgi:hypothetical protein